MEDAERFAADISIHAPRTGSDIMYEVEHNYQWISIHAPRTGSDFYCGTGYINQDISIHAPRTGSDDLFDASKRFGNYFNPRSPHGERRN